MIARSSMCVSPCRARLRRRRQAALAAVESAVASQRVLSAVVGLVVRGSVVRFAGGLPPGPPQATCPSDSLFLETSKGGQCEGCPFVSKTRLRHDARGIGWQPHFRSYA